jgi:putative membrane protein
VPEPQDPRVALANERTLLSWIRLALALVGAGTTIGTVAAINPVWLHVVVAVVPVVLGLIAALLGYARWQRVDDAVRSGVALPADRELRLVAAAVALIAVIAGVAAVVGIFAR